MDRKPEDQGCFRKVQQRQHPGCVVCGPASVGGLGLEFRSVGDGVVEATFACQRSWEGYPHMLHGGVVCALLDGAMTNCMFSLGSAAVTGDLHVRFCLPVDACKTATIRAWVESSSPPLYKLAAHVQQDGELKAHAHARFVERETAARFNRQRSSQ